MYFGFDPGLQIQGPFGLWVMQLIEQALGSKREGFHPKVVIGPAHARLGVPPISFDIPEHLPPVVKQMLVMHILEVLVALLADQKYIQFVTHDAVGVYKRETKRLLQSAILEPTSVTTEELLAGASKQLRLRTKTQFIEIILYQHLPEERRAFLHEQFTAAFPLAITTTFVGSDWNHHSFQSAFGRDDTLYLIVAPTDDGPQIEGVATSTVAENARVLKAIACAT